MDVGRHPYLRHGIVFILQQGYLTQEKNIEVIGDLVQYHFYDEWPDHVHFILERIE